MGWFSLRPAGFGVDGPNSSGSIEEDRAWDNLNSEHEYKYVKSEVRKSYIED